jgi:outer membrane protein OmpA-like peptidoglycan-associated protein
VNDPGLRPIRILILFFVLLSTFTRASAQSLGAPTFAVSGGYSGYNPRGTSSGVHFGRLPIGWTSTAAIQFTPRYSFIADVGGYSDSKIGSTQTYLLGPKFTFHRGPFSPFAEVMMGAQHLAPKGQASNVAFTEAAGGGLDVSVARRWSVRLFQADFLYAANHEKGKTVLNQFFGMRVSAGVVWNFGKARRPMVAAEKPSGAKPPSDTPSKPEQTAVAVEEAKTTPPPAPVASATPVTEPVSTVKAELAAEASAPSTAQPAVEPPANVTAKPASETSAPVAAQPTAETSAPVTGQPSPETSGPVTAQPVVEPSTSVTAQPGAGTSTPVTAQSSAGTSTPVTAQPAAETSTTPAVEVAKAQPVPTIEPAVAAVAVPSPAPVAVAATVPAPVAVPAPAIQQVAQLRFPYDQYPSLLSTQDKRALDALASRMKLEPKSTAVVVGTATPRSGKLAAQRAVNSKDYLVQKGIDAARVQVLERASDPQPPSKSAKSKSSTKPVATQLVYVPAGASFENAGATAVDEQAVKPEHFHVAHPEWHEK